MDRINRHFDAWIRGALAALALALILLSALLIRQYQQLREQSLTGPNAPWLSRFHGAPRAPLTDVTLIQPWMTYDYIGHSYGLPIDYLKTALSITDARYPRLTVSESAEAQNLSADALLAAVRAAVSTYLAGTKNGT